MKHTGKEKEILLALFLAGGLSAAALTACSRQTNVPVVAEKQSEAGEAHGTQTGVKNEESEGNHISSGQKSGSADTNQSGADKSSGQGLKEAVEAPERYRTSVEGNRISLTADAEVVLPDVDAIPIYEGEKQPYGQDDFTHFKRVTEFIIGSPWQEEKQEGDWGLACRSQDEQYKLSLVDGAEKGRTPILWISHRFIGAGTSAEYSANDLSGLTLSKEEKEKVETDMDAAARECLDRLEAGEFELKSCRWKALSVREGEFAAGKQDGTYGVLLKYVRRFNKIPVSGSLPAFFGERTPQSQYVEFLYSSDGTLLMIKAVGRQNYKNVVEEDPFLLPFAAAAQIFEQYAKTYYDDENHRLIKDELNTLRMTDDEKEKAVVHVNSVQLEYRFEHEGQTGEADEAERGRLVPVWNFYGSLMAGKIAGDSSEPSKLTAEEPFLAADGLLVSINAADGTIYGN